MGSDADSERAERAAKRRANASQTSEVVVLGQEPVRISTTQEERFGRLRVLSERLWRFGGREIDHPPRDQYPGEVFETRRG